MKTGLKMFALLILTAVLIVSCDISIRSVHNPKNVILFIGDGMGVTQVTAGKFVNGKLYMEEFKNVGLVTTYSADHLVTDSGAGGTVLATGVKTYNHAIGVAPDSTPVKTVLEYAEEQGKYTGLVTTCALTHATPADFASHVVSRKMYNEIAEQIAGAGIEVLFGGGWSNFVPASVEGSRRKDSLNLLDTLKKNMQIALTKEQFEALDTLRPAAAMLAPGHPGKVAERPVSLAELTAKAIKILSKNDDGFFLMVEGSQIDWGGHDNDPDYIISEVIDFDKAVGEGLKFARKNGETLIVVTADHETGGFSIIGGDVNHMDSLKTAFTTDYHSAAMVPLFSYGPGSEKFCGILDNTDVGKRLIEMVKR